MNKHFLKYQSPAIFWALIIFIASSIPSVAVPKLGLRFEDKWQHLIVYGILGILVARALVHQSRFIFLKKYFILYAILFSGFYGFIDEFHQSFVPGRYPEIWDALVDFIGAVAGVLIYRFRLNTKKPELAENRRSD